MCKNRQRKTIFVGDDLPGVPPRKMILQQTVSLSSKKGQRTSCILCPFVILLISVIKPMVGGKGKVGCILNLVFALEPKNVAALDVVEKLFGAF